MSRSPYPTYPPHHPHHGRPFIAVHAHDILCGRGVNIASHGGNERFRSLVQLRLDENYCTAYTTSEKRAVAEQILRHIRTLDPPGRFLKRIGRAPTSRGLNGPWEELTDREAIKKTCQALRDCSRQDRTGYAAAVAAPDDVRRHAQSRTATGLSNKEHAAAAATAKARAEGAVPTPPGAPAHPPRPPHAGSMMGVAMAPGPIPMTYHHGIPGVVPIPMPVPMGVPMAIRSDLSTTSHPHAYAAPPMLLPPPPPPPHPLHHQAQQPPHQLYLHHLAPHPPPHHQLHHQQVVPQDSAAHRSSPHPGTNQLYSPPGQVLQHLGARIPQAVHHLQGYAHENPRKRPSNGFEDDRTASPSIENAAEWLKKQKTVDTRVPRAVGMTPSDSMKGAPAYLSEGLLTGYDISGAARTPSQETSTTTGTTPTTGGTIASRANRPSLSPASAMPPSPTLAYDAHHAGAGNPTLYSHHHDFSSPPTPTPADPFAFHHEHPVVSSNPSSELPSSKYSAASVQLDQQQLQAAAEAAAFAVAAADGHNGNDYATGSPNPYHHDDSLLSPFDGNTHTNG